MITGRKEKKYQQRQGYYLSVKINKFVISGIIFKLFCEQEIVKRRNIILGYYYHLKMIILHKKSFLKNLA